MTDRVTADEEVLENSRVRRWLASVSLFFYRHKAMSAMLLLTILIFGGLSYTTLLKREGFPTIDVPITLVKGTYLVDDAKQVDEQVTIPVAQAIGEIEGIDSVSTSSQANFFTAVVFSDNSTLSEEVQKKIATKLDEEVELPSQVRIEMESINPSNYYNKYDALIAVYSPDSSLNTSQLSEMAKYVAEKLPHTNDIAQAIEIDQITQGINPATGQPAIQQTSYGRIGTFDENGVFVLQEAVNVGVLADEDVGSLELADAMESALADINQAPELDSGMATVAADESRVIESQINSLQSNMLTALLAVAFISFLFISWRASVTTGIFMVAVMGATLAILLLIGYTLNTIVLFGLVLALGLFVDDATIITEAIDADRKEKNPEKTIQKAIFKVAMASFAGTFTTVLVFTPLLFLSGVLGEFIRLLPITVIISLLVSLTLSLTLIPFLSRYTLLSKSSMKRVGKYSPINKAERALGRFFSSLPMLLKKRRTLGRFVATVLVIVSIVSVLGAAKLAKGLDFNIFPQADDSDDIALNITYLPNTPMEQAQNIADQLSVQAAEIIGNDVLVSVSYGKRTPPSPRLTEVIFELTPFREREVTSQQLLAQIDESLVGFTQASVRTYQIGAGPPSEDTPFKMQIFGEDTAQTAVFGNEVVAFLDGAQVTVSNGKTANITKVSLANVMQYERIDGKRYIEVRAGYDENNVSALVEATQTMVEQEFSGEELATYGLSYGDSVKFDFGQESENADSFNSVAMIIPLALGLMFLLLALQFRSLIKPLIIFIAIPFSLFGVFAGLTVTGNPMSFFVRIGLIGLIGIVVNNAILIVDYANQEREKGKDAVEAISIALEERFRPLITTTTITVVALLPLAVYDPFWEPLAVTIMFGLISATTLVIIAFPYYYIGADNLGTWIKSKYRKVRGKA